MPLKTTMLGSVPELAAQWHPTKNGNLTPNDVTLRNKYRAWWLCPDCGHEWPSTVANRSCGSGCPICSPAVRAAARLRRNGSLQSSYPNIAAQWHPTKNGDLTPDQVTKKSNRRVWWLCPDCGHEWITSVGNRAGGTGCPVCNHKRSRTQ